MKEIWKNRALSNEILVKSIKNSIAYRRIVSVHKKFENFLDSQIKSMIIAVKGVDTDQYTCHDNKIEYLERDILA